MTHIYSQETLEEVMKRDSATFVDYYPNYLSLHCRSKITFRCFCGEERTKCFQATIEGGAFCRPHQTERWKEKMIREKGYINVFQDPEYQKKRIKYNEKYLHKILQENNCTLIRIVNLPLKRESNIEFSCPCHPEVVSSLNFRNLEKLKAKCNPLTEEERRKNFLKTMMAEYGVENPLHDPELFEKCKKNSYLNKDFTLPSGDVISIQGYEHFAMRDLLRQYDEYSIMVGSKDRKEGLIPLVRYTFKGKNKAYHPDMFIPLENKIIEVKSEFTFYNHEEQNLAKRRACWSQGYEFEFMFYNRNGQQLGIDV